MPSSGKAKKARRHVFRDQGRIDDLPEGQRKYIQKKANRYMNAMTGQNVPAFEAREFPCQMINENKVLISIDAEPEFNEEDGKWYLDGELIVSSAWKNKQKVKNKVEVVEDDAETAITNMEPEVLGEE